jgi:outer membrane protein
VLALPAAASSDPFSGVAAPGGVGISPAWRIERSPYRGAGTRNDFLPLYLYEGDRFYLHSNSIGLRFGSIGVEPRYELFLRRRLEGHPSDRIPESLLGMASRSPGVDAGAAAQVGGSWGIAFAEVLHDVSATSNGSELRLGYKYPWRSGRFWVRPHAMLAFRDARLNDYYYGVRAEEANAERPAYRAGGGLVPEIGIYAAYSLTERWRLIGGATWARWSKSIVESPIVEQRSDRTVTVGLMYDVSPDQQAWPETRPLIMRAYYGASSDCNVLHIVRLRCTSTHTSDNTDVAAFEVGRPFIDRLNGWPLDLAGFLGLLRHKEKGLQPDFWQVNAYIKAYYYGFPWDATTRTRIGLGVGLAYARRVPFVEQRDQTARGRTTSKLLNTFDPTVDVSVGDLVGSRPLRDTYVGLGVAHRSGIFGSSQLLGNVNGGSNYIYGYLEWTL